MSTEATFTRGATFAGAEFAEHAYSMGKRSPTRALGSVSVRRAGVSSNGVTFARTRGSKYAGNLRAEDLALALLNFGSIPSKRITRPILRPEPQHARWPYNIPGVLEDRTEVFRTHGHACLGGTLDLEHGRFPAQLRTVWPVHKRVARDTVLISGGRVTAGSPRSGRCGCWARRPRKAAAGR
jgi:hypothetical protein